MDSFYDVDWTQHARLCEFAHPSEEGVMYPEFEPQPTEAELEEAARQWPAWLFDNETNYPLGAA